MNRALVMAVCLLSAVALLGAGHVHADDQLDELVRGIETAYRAMHDLRATFEQQTGLAGTAGQQGRGTVCFKKGGLMRWEYSAPEPQQIILDGTTLWVYQPDDRQVMKNSYRVLPSNIVADLFQGRIDLQHTFRVSPAPSDIPRETGERVLDLVPREATPTVARVRLWIDPCRQVVTATTVQDAFGSTTTLRFRDIVINGGVADELFRFEVPPGVDVFEPPQF